MRNSKHNLNFYSLIFKVKSQPNSVNLVLTLLIIGAQFQVLNTAKSKGIADLVQLSLFSMKSKFANFFKLMVPL